MRNCKVGQLIRVVRPRKHLALHMNGTVMQIDLATGMLDVQLEGRIPEAMRQYPVGHARENWVRLHPDHCMPGLSRAQRDDRTRERMEASL